MDRARCSRPGTIPGDPGGWPWASRWCPWSSRALRLRASDSRWGRCVHVRVDEKRNRCAVKVEEGPIKGWIGGYVAPEEWQALQGALERFGDGQAPLHSWAFTSAIDQQRMEQLTTGR